MDMRDEARQIKKRAAVNRRRSSVWLWMIVGILLCQIAGTAAWSQFRYRGDGDGQARIARLVTNMEFDIIAGDLPEKPGETTQLNFMVTNFEEDRVSDAQLQYTAELNTAGNLPLTFYLSPNEAGGTTDGNWIMEGSMTGNTVSQPGILRHGEKITHRYTLSISWPPETEAEDYQYADEIDYVRIRIHAEQVSPN